MIRARALGLLLAAAIAGCAWSNSLYEARRFSRDAARAEREHRPGDALSLWTQVIVRAESAYARGPAGPHGAEALWLAGHSYARTGDCTRAIPALEGALFSRPDPRWRQQLLLDLGQCDEATGNPTAASIYAMVIGSGTDSALRRSARIRQGHVLVRQGHWSEGLAVLSGEDTLPARLDRAMALARLGRTSESYHELEPLLARADTSVNWLDFVEAFAAHNSAVTDSLLARVMTFSRVRDERRSGWLLAAVRASIATDPVAATRWLHQLAARPSGLSVNEGQALQWELRMLGAASPAELRAVLDTVRRLSEGEGSVLGRLASLREGAQRLVDRNDSTRAGASRGDLTMFALAEFARDTIGAPQLASWLFERIERDWPASPYLPKALLALARLRTDSEEPILARARQFTASPYILAAAGDPAAQARLVPLEDSLRKYIGTFWSSMPHPGRVNQDRE